MKIKTLLVSMLSVISIIGSAQTHLDGIEYYKCGYIDEAKNILTYSLNNSNPNKSLSYYYLGLISLNQNNVDEAKYYFDNGIKENKDNGYNYIGLGALALKNGNAKSAEEQFKQAEKLLKKDAAAEIDIARAYYDVDPLRYAKEIEKRVELARKINSKAPEIYIFLGDQDKDRKNWVDAVSKYELAKIYDVNATDAYVKYANLYSQVNPQYAVNMLKELVSLKPTSALAQRELANVSNNKNGNSGQKEYAINTQKANGNNKVSNANSTATKPNINRLQSANNVNDYISLNLPDINSFVKERTASIEIPTADKIKKAIESDITAWQTKGEFETTSEWNNRVNDITRKDRINKLTDEWKEKTQKAKELYDIRAKNAQSEYQQLRNKYAEEYYAYKTEEALKKCNASIVSLNSPYDADNQVFLINSSIYGDILLNVPRSDAPAFKKNWENISKNITYEFAPSDESNVTLSKIVFSMNGKRYTYDGKSEAAYTIADINYNFAPIEIEDIDFDINSLPALSDNAPIQTLTTTGISAKKVNVNRTSINASTGDESKSKPKGKSDVDQNIPNVNKPRNNTFALIIANENYRRVSEVPFALNDGEIFHEYLNKTLGIPEKNILSAQDASLNDIRYNLKRLQDICGVFKGDASVIVYYAGHGVPDGKSLDAYLLPVDGYADDPATGLALSELTKTLAELPTKQTTLFIDACFSGTGREGGMLSEARGVKLRPKEAVVDGNLIVFSASQGVETAHPLIEQGHGMFTYYLLKKINETRGKVKLGDLAEYLINNVSRTSVLDGNMQTPTVKTSLKDWESLEL